MNIKKHDCEDCKDLAEGEVIKGHDHRQPRFQIGDKVHFNHQTAGQPHKIANILQRPQDFMVEFADKEMSGLFNESLFTKING